MVQTDDEQNIVASLSDALDRHHHLVRAQGIEQAGGTAIVALPLPAYFVSDLPLQQSGCGGTRAVARKGRQHTVRNLW